MATFSTTIWKRLAVSPRLQRSSQSLSVLGSQAFVFGGELLSRRPVDNQLDVIDVVGATAGTDHAIAKTVPAPNQAPTPRVGSPSTTIGDAFYLFSGRGGLAMMPVEEKGALWRYTPTGAKWDLVEPTDPSSPFPAGRSYHAIASDDAETIYLHAGCPENGRLSDLWSFNVTSRVWNQLPDAPPPGRGGSSLTFAVGKLYRMNGFDGSRELGGSIEVFDPATVAWSTISFQPDGIYGPVSRSVGALVAISVQGRDYLATLFGEHDPSSLGHAGAGKMLSDVWFFGLESQQWTRIEPGGASPAPRGWFDSDVVRESNGRQGILVHGGLAEDNARLGDVWKLQFH